MRAGVLLGSLLGGVLLTSVIFGTVSADIIQGSNITTSPVTLTLNGKPGTSVSTTLQMQNNASTPVEIKVSVQTFRAHGTDGQAQILPPGPGNDSLNWVHLSKQSFTAQPGVWVPVQMTINIPAGAGLGYYYAVLFSPATGVRSSASSGVIKGSNAILVLLNAQSGNARPKLQVTSFTASRKLYEYLPADFSITVKNAGNIFLPPSGNVFISKSADFSHIIDSIDINPTQGNVLPASTRVFPATWDKGFPAFEPKTVNGQRVTDKKGNLIKQLSWDFSKANKFRFGKYYAKLVFVYNDGSRDIPTQAVISFWVIPWKLMTMILVLLILLGVGLYVVTRKIAGRTRHHISMRANKR